MNDSGYEFGPNVDTIESAVYETIGRVTWCVKSLAESALSDALLEIGQALINFIERKQMDAGTLNVAASVVHETFRSFLNAGFNEQQSMYLIGEMLKKNYNSEG